MLEVANLSKEYPTPQGRLSILNGVSLKLSRGDAVSIMGPSGSGKSTLLYIVGALEPPTNGTVMLDAQNPFQLKERELAAFRNEKIGFIFQDHCLLPQCTVLENVLTPTLVARANGNDTERAQALLDQVGLGGRLDHRPAELSGGEKQRVALSRGDAVSIMGPSGSGKSTLLYIFGALEPPTNGTVMLDGQNPFQLKERELAAFRNEKIGFIFQDHCLLPQCTVLENVLTPTLVARANGNDTERARALLDQVGLGGRLEHRPAELSGGEKQRVALARALIMKPLLLLCDEPTGNLDQQSAEVAASLLMELHQRQETILIVVTHSAELAARFPARFELVEQRLQSV